MSYSYSSWVPASSNKLSSIKNGGNAMLNPTPQVTDEGMDLDDENNQDHKSQLATSIPAQVPSSPITAASCAPVNPHPVPSAPIPVAVPPPEKLPEHSELPESTISLQPLEYHEQTGEVIIGPGAERESRMLGIGLPKLRGRDRDSAERAKRFAMDMSVKLIMQQQSKLQQQNQAKKALYQQAISLMSRVYIGNIPLDVDERGLKAMFSPFGPVKWINMTPDPATGTHKGFAFMEFEIPEATELALLQMNGAIQQGQVLKVNHCYTLMQQARPVIDQILADGKKHSRVYVSSIHSDLSEKDIHAVFASFGNVVDCTLAKSNDGKHLGYGYILYDKEQSANEAVNAMNLFDLGGQHLRVIRAITPPVTQMMMASSDTTLPTASAMAAAQINAKIKAMQAVDGPAPVKPASPTPATPPKKGKFGAKVEAVPSPNATNGSTPPTSFNNMPAGYPPHLGAYQSVPNVPAVPNHPLYGGPPRPPAGPGYPGWQPPITTGYGQQPPPHLSGPLAISYPGHMPPPGTVPGYPPRPGYPPQLALPGVAPYSRPGYVPPPPPPIQANTYRPPPPPPVAKPPVPIDGTTNVILLKNMATSVDDNLHGEVTRECSKYGSVRRVIICQERYGDGPKDLAVKIFVQFQQTAEGDMALLSLDGRLFAGNTIKAEPYNQALFEKGDYSH